MSKKSLSVELSPEEKEQLYQLWKSGVSLAQIAEQTGRNKNTITKYKQQEKWEERKSFETNQQFEIIEYHKQIMDMSPSELRKDSIRELEVCINYRIKEIRRDLLSSDTADEEVNRRLANISNEMKRLVETLKDAQHIEQKEESGGIEKTAHLEVKYDVTEMLKLKLEAKRLGINVEGRNLIEEYDSIKKMIENAKVKK